MSIVILPAVVMVFGILLWTLFPNHPKLTEAGKILFFCGALVVTWTLGSERLRF